MRPVNIFTGSSGLNNVVDPVRLPFNRESGVSDLEEAANVLIGKSGSVVSRRGMVKVAEGSFHSMFRHGDVFYIVKERETDSAIYQAIPGPSGQVVLEGIRSGMAPGARVDYCELGDAVFYCNGHQNGVIREGTSYPWPENDWTGPESTADFAPPPVGHHLGLLSGRLLISRDDLLYFTEYGLPGLVDQARNIARFESKVLLIAPVDGGVFVSDEKAIYFLVGNNPHEWTKRKVAEYPALEWGRLPELVDASVFGFETAAMATVFATNEGPVVGLPDGSLFNLINKKVKTPGCCTSGAIMVVDETMIIQSGE